MVADTLLRALMALEPGIEAREKADRPAIRVPRERLHAIAARLRDDPELAFDMLVDHTAIDWVDQGRFELVYHLYSTRHGHAATVTALVPRDEPVAPTVSDIWPVAEWQEREAYDLLGILYDEHPDLRRVFLEDEWQGFPLRKDYRDPDMIELPK